jgi:hypothetical protein
MWGKTTDYYLWAAYLDAQGTQHWTSVSLDREAADLPDEYQASLIDKINLLNQELTLSRNISELIRTLRTWAIEDRSWLYAGLDTETCLSCQQRDAIFTTACQQLADQLEARR